MLSRSVERIFERPFPQAHPDRRCDRRGVLHCSTVGGPPSPLAGPRKDTPATALSAPPAAGKVDLPVAWRPAVWMPFWRTVALPACGLACLGAAADWMLVGALPRHAASACGLALLVAVADAVAGAMSNVHHAPGFEVSVREGAGALRAGDGPGLELSWIDIPPPPPLSAVSSGRLSMSRSCPRTAVHSL